MSILKHFKVSLFFNSNENQWKLFPRTERTFEKELNNGPQKQVLINYKVAVY